MASESTELTFVRCPSCRSLVPASATRCRICNNPLDGAAKMDDGDASKNASRVRQKTMSAAPEEVAEAISKARSENVASSESSAPPPVVAAVGAEPEEAGVDPLSAYLQELEESDSGAAASEKSPVTDPLGMGEELEEGFDFDMLKPEREAAPVEAFAGATPTTASLPVEKPAPKPWETQEVEIPDASPAAPQKLVEPPSTAPQRLDPPVGKSSSGAEAPSPKNDLRSDNITTGGSQSDSPNGGRRGLNFGALASPRPPQEDSRSANQGTVQQVRSDRNQDQRRGRDQQNGQPNQRDANSQRDQGNQSRREEGKKLEQNRDRDRDRDRGVRGTEDRTSPLAPQPQSRGNDRPVTSGPKPGKSNPGRLFGWLVSYVNPDGRGIELREGKFFVTSSSIKGTDLVLEDPTVSTPHALMFVSADQGLSVQDLMSERGVFIKSRDSGAYQREEATATLKNGDWVRFGDLEFLVSLIPTSQNH